MRTEGAIDINKWHCKENFISFNFMPETNFDPCPVPPSFARVSHILSSFKLSNNVMY